VKYPVLCSPAQLTTVVSFLPVFFLEAQEGKLFTPLAYTKTFALISAYLLGIAVLPTLVYYIFSIRITSEKVRQFANILLIAAGIALVIFTGYGLYIALTFFGLNNLFAHQWKNQRIPTLLNIGIALLAVVYLLTMEWLPMGTEGGVPRNLLFVILIIALILALLWMLVIYYEKILRMETWQTDGSS